MNAGVAAAVGELPIDPRGWSTEIYLVLIVGLFLLRVVARGSGCRAALFLNEICLILPAALTYFLIRGGIDARAGIALTNAERVVAAERALGIAVEARLQGLILDHPVLVNLSNWVYVWGHWPVIAGWTVWMWSRHRAVYHLYRNAVLLSGAAAMAVFALFPVAPPRLVPDLGVVDLVAQQSRAYRVLQPPALTNPYAAVPSLHFGWNLLVGLAVVRHAAHPVVRWAGAILPVAMFAAIVLTGNHYILDGVAGGAFALASLAVVTWWSRSGWRVPSLGRAEAPAAGSAMPSWRPHPFSGALALGEVEAGGLCDPPREGGPERGRPRLQADALADRRVIAGDQGMGAPSGGGSRSLSG